MPRLVNRPPSYRRHKASGSALVVINGRRIYLGRYGSPESRQAYKRLLAQWDAGQRALAPGAVSAALSSTSALF